MTMPAEIEQESSPFLPNSIIQFAWDSTSLGWLKTCPRLYQYNMLERLTGKEESIHLRFGIEIHRALQDYKIHKAEGYKHDDAVFGAVYDLMVRTDNWRPDHKYKNRNNLIRSAIWYFDHYRNDPAKTYIMEDGKPAVELNFKFELDFAPSTMPDGPNYIVCGHLDEVVEFNSASFIMDHKTTTSTPGEYYFDQFSPSNQMSLYTLAGNVVLDTVISGVIVDAIQVGVDFSRFTRGLTYRTKDQIEEWLRDLAVWLSRAEEYALEGYWPQNDTACDKFGGCKYRSVCSKSPQVREAFIKSDFIVGEQWNPTQQRE